MSVTALNRVKKLMVASCDALHQGHRDIASNMMELALDEMASLKPEDVEIGLPVVEDAAESETAAAAETAFENEDFGDDEMTDEVASQNLNDIVRNMVAAK